MKIHVEVYLSVYGNDLSIKHSMVKERNKLTNLTQKALSRKLETLSLAFT